MYYKISVVKRDPNEEGMNYYTAVRDYSVDCAIIHRKKGMKVYVADFVENICNGYYGGDIYWIIVERTTAVNSEVIYCINVQ